MKVKIFEVIKEMGPKHFSRRIKNTPDLWEWVLDQTKDITEEITVSERIYLAVIGESPVCYQGKKKKFKTFTNGYGFCGTTGVCACAQQQIGQKVSESKQSYSDERNQEINKKREQTVLKRYGVTNNAQTDYARQKHQKYYEDQDNVRTSLERQRNTFQQKYGPYVTNAAHLPQHNKRMTSENNPMKNNKSVRKAIATKQSRYSEDYYKRISFSNIVSILQERNIEILVETDDYDGVNNNYNFKCINCSYIWNQILYRTTSVICKHCNPTQCTFKSGEENSVRDFLQGLGIKVVQRNQSLIGQQLDLICPDHKIAIEYCGLYYHTELDKPNASGRNKSYHVDKLDKVEAIGWRLITIFSDEWTKNRLLVENILKHIFGVNSQRLYARSTKVVELNWTKTRIFLDKHHLQGRSQGTFCNLGLMYCGEIVAVMTFSQLRKALNSRKINDSYELVRFATNGANIVGGASKLLTFFIRKYNPEMVISYADRRWSQGNLYQTLGFKIEHISPPSYWYSFDYEVRFHRFNFRKQKLIKMGHDKAKTEWEIMRFDLGYDRIWDCGTMKFVWIK